MYPIADPFQMHKLMADRQPCDRPLPLLFQHQLFKQLRAVRIQIGERLIHNHQLRPEYQSADKRKLLLLPAA